MGFALSLLWTSCVAQNALQARLPPSLAGADIRLAGHVDDFVDATASGVRFTLRITATEQDALLQQRVRISSWDRDFVPAPGEWLDLTARLREPHGFVNPEGFDYERWLLREGISATGYVRELHARRMRHGGLNQRLLMAREAIRTRIAGSVSNTAAAALITALAIGERSAFSDLHWERFRRTGTSHLVAISGLHVGIIAMVAFSFVTLSGRVLARTPVEASRLVASITAFCAAVCYAALAGFAVSTVRAVIMLAVGLLIVNLRRRVSAVHGLALAAVIVIAMDPFVTLSAAFWLSFGAVATLLAATCARSVAAPVRHRGTWLAAAVKAQTAIACMSIPAGALVFGEFSLAAFPVNLIAVPFFSFVLVPLVLSSVSTAMIFGRAGPLWDASEYFAHVAMLAIEKAGAPDAVAIQTPVSGGVTTVVAFVGAVMLLPWLPGRSRYLCALAVVPLVWPSNHAHLAQGDVRLTVLDVGHGLAVLVETQSQMLVYDAGARFASGFDVGNDIVAPVLRSRRNPDVVVISHSDNDHIGGAAAIVANWPRVRVIHGPDVDSLEGERCIAGQAWSTDGVSFEFLHPERSFSARGNDSSCVLKVTGNAGSVLLAGDIERRGEAAVAARGAADVDVVVAPHHGSATSSGPALVAATMPSVVVFSAGYRNRWGFPADPVVARWCAAGAAVYVTGEQGATEIALSADLMTVHTLRTAERRYWRTVATTRCGESTTGTL